MYNRDILYLVDLMFIGQVMTLNTRSGTQSRPELRDPKSNVHALNVTAGTPPAQVEKSACVFTARP